MTPSLCVCLSVCLSLASDSSETIKVIIIIKRGMLTASDMRMHHVLSILTLTFIQGHTDVNHENAIPIKFAMKIGRRKVYIIFSVR